MQLSMLSPSAVITLKYQYSKPTFFAAEDILDEYLMSDRIAMPHEETIPEEDESNNAVLDRLV